MTWNDITTLQYENLKGLYETNRSNFANDAITYLYGIKQPEVNLPISEYTNYLHELAFFKEPIPKAKLKDKYTVNGTTYKLDMVLANLSAVQFMDFQNYSKQPTKSIVDLVSVVLVPEGAKYNDGTYDLEKAKEDIGTMSVADTNAIMFFFANWFRHFASISLDFLNRKMKKMKDIPEDKKQEILEKMELLKKMAEQITT